MSKKNRKQAERANPLILARVPLWRSEWEEFRALCESLEPPASPYDMLASLVRAINDGDLIPEHHAGAPRQ